MAGSAGVGELTALLRDRAFLLLQSRSTAVTVGYSVYLGTILWLSYRLTGGIELAGLLISLETAVYLLTFLVGPVVDRLPDKRLVYLLCYPVQSAAALAMGIAYELHALSVPLLVALVVVLAVLWDFTWAADNVASRTLFGKDRLFAVSGLGSALGGGVDIGLYFVAGATIAFFGAAGGSYLYAGLLAAGAGLAFLLPIRGPANPDQPYAASFRDGWAHYRGSEGRPLRQLALVQFAYGFFVSAPPLLLTLDVVRFDAGSQATYAALYVAYLIGGILAGLLVGALNPRAWLGPLSLATLVGAAVALFGAAAVAGAPVWAGVAWAVVGAATTARAVAFATYLQGIFPADRLARIAANNFVFPGISGTIGAFAVGYLSTRWSPTVLTDVVAAGFVGAALLGWSLTEIRTLRY